MNTTNRSAGRSGKASKETTIVSKTESAKAVDKDKRYQATVNQIHSSTVIVGATNEGDVDKESIKKVMEITKKERDEVILALIDSGNDVNGAIHNLYEGKGDEWQTTKKKKSKPVGTSLKSENHTDAKENDEYADNRNAVSAVPNRSFRGNRGIRDRRGGGTLRQNDRNINDNRRWRGRDKENDRNNEDGNFNSSGGGYNENGPLGRGGPRDYRGRDRRIMNGPSRGPSRGGRGGRGGRSSAARTFQSRDNRDRGGGFPNQIDTWANPPSADKQHKTDEFQTPDEWCYEEYTGSLADSKVFTPSAQVEVEPPIIPSATFVSECHQTVSISSDLSTVKEETSLTSLNVAPPPQPSLQNSIIPSMVIGSNQLTPDQTRYFNQLASQASENRKAAAAAAAQQQQLVSQVVQQKTQQASSTQQQASSLIYNSSLNAASQPYSNAQLSQSSFPVITQANFTQNSNHPQPSQSFASITISQSYSAAPSYQPVSGAYNVRPPAEFSPTNYSDMVSNYNAHGLPNSSSLSPRVKPQRQPSQSKVSNQVGDIEISTPDASMNTAMKLIDMKFSSLEFSNSDTYDTSGNTNAADSSVLSNKYSAANMGGPPVTNNSNAELTINSFQSSQQKQVHPSNGTGISSVLAQNKQFSVNDSSLTSDANVYSQSTVPNSRPATIQELKNASPEIQTLQYGMAADSTHYQNPQQAYQKSASVSSTYHQTSTPASSYNPSSYGPPTQVSTSANVFSEQQSQTYTGSNSVPFSSVYGAASGISNNSTNNSGATTAIHNSVYHNNSYQPPSVSTFQSYLSAGGYPTPIVQPYQGNVAAAGITQAPYLGTQYAGATYGAAPFHNYTGVSNTSIQSPIVTTLPQSHKITAAGTTKESQYENVQQSVNTTVVGTGNSMPVAVTGVASSVAALTLSPTTTTMTTSAKVTSSSSSGGSKSGTSMLPSMPPGMAPVVGHQYIMSQPVYQPAAFLNFDDLQYIQRGIHPHMPAGYVDMNYSGPPQTNMATAGRDALNVPFSSMSDGRFSRPDNTTSPVPPPTAATLNQQNNASAHQQPMLNPQLLQTYAAAYIYPYQQYSTPIYQVATSPATGGHGTTNNAIAAGPFAKAPSTGYNSTGFASQYDSLSGANQSNMAEYGNSKMNNTNAGGSYSGSQQSAKVPGNSGQTNSASSTDLPVNMYSGKSHTALNKSYDKQSFHSGAPAPFTMPGSAVTGGMGNAPSANAATAPPYASPLYIHGGVPQNAAGANPNHPQHLHQSAHHQDSTDMRNSGMADRNFFISGTRSNYH